jgi:Co/Zn/Cd efflux system component
MESNGLVTVDEEQHALTESGRKQAAERLTGVRRFGELLRSLLEPATAARVSLVAHLGLAAVKLPAAWLSGSVGLLNDAADTLLDGVSSLLVYAGIRWDRERWVNVGLVAVMAGTGLFTLYEAVQRLWQPQAPEADAISFGAAFLSAVVCLTLGTYQRYVGTRTATLSLVTQAVDSRNHVVVAASVAAGLLASLARFPLLDTLVGLGVSLLILWSSAELVLDVIRSRDEEAPEMAPYAPAMLERYDQFRQQQMQDWMLYLVGAGLATSRDEVTTQAQQAVDLASHPVLRALGLQSTGLEQLVEPALHGLIGPLLLAKPDGSIVLTPAGRERLRRSTRRSRSGRHRLTPRHGPRRSGHWQKPGLPTPEKE